MDDYFIDIIKNNKVEEFNDELKEKYKQYIQNTDHDILIYAIENATSLEIINSIIKWYDKLDYKAYSEKIDDYRPPLFVAIALNKFSFAHLLLENKASIYYASLYSVDKYLNNENLCYMIDIGISISDDFLVKKFKELINGNDNDIISLGKCFKCLLIRHNDELDLKEFGTYSIPIQMILYEVVKFDNYYLLEKSFEYCSNKEEGLLNVIFKLFDGFSKHLHQNKKDDFINNIRNKDLKNKIKNYFDEKELPDKKREKILDIAKSGNLKKLQQYIYDNKIELKSLNDEYFDILISAIENKVPVKTVKYIINQCHYQNFDYYITYNYDFLNILNHDEVYRHKLGSKIYKYFNYKISPIYIAIANNNFIISNLLLNYRDDINYKKGYTKFDNNIITYLYEYKLLNFENLTYILNDGIKIFEIKDKIVMDFINNYYFDITKEEDKKYSEYSCSFLEIFLKNIKEYNIRKDHYKFAVNNNNIIALIILLNYDKTNKNDVLLECDGLKDSILEQINSIKSFYECNFYYNINKENGYINEKTFLNLKSYIIQFYQSFYINREKIIHKLYNLRYKNKNSFNVDEFEKFLKDNNIFINELNSSNFDILLYAIEDNAPDELIKYIIDQYETLNYSDKRTPLIAAINKRNFDIADYLLDKGAKINYNNNYSIIDEIDLSLEKIQYIFSNNYTVSTENDNNKYIQKIISKYFNDYDDYDDYDEYYNHNKRFNDGILVLETYLKCSSIKEKKIKIDDSIYESVIKDNNIKALLLLYEHDYRDKDIVSTIIYNNYYDNTIYLLNMLNDNEAKKLISKL